MCVLVCILRETFWKTKQTNLISSILDSFSAAAARCRPLSVVVLSYWWRDDDKNRRKIIIAYGPPLSESVVRSLLHALLRAD